MRRLRFDTRDTKPTLKSVLIATGVLALAVLILLATGFYRHTTHISAVFCIYFAAVFILLIHAFREQVRYNPYSYNTIYYMGFALFDLAVLIMQILLTVNFIKYPDIYRGSMIIHQILGSPKVYLLLSAPFLFIFSAALVISNISLLRHEGKSFVNILGIILAFLLTGGVLFIFFYDMYASGSVIEVMMHDLVVNVFAAVFLYFDCMMIGTIAADYMTAKYEPDPDKDYIIILGCGLRKDGTPTPLLRGRIDRALDFAKKQEEQTGRAPYFVTSGGQGPDEAVSESASMKRYLMEQGVPEERIIEEDRSTNTEENMKFSKEKILERDPDAKIAFSTTNYHVFRSGLFARRVKMRAQGMGAGTKWYFWPNAAVREFVGLLTKHRGKQALILLSMIVFYAVLTLFAYLGIQ